MVRVGKRRHGKRGDKQAMTETFMLTIPRTVCKRILRIMIEANDCKKWVIGKENGKNGYEHWQIRVQTSNDKFFEWIKNNIPQAHVEKCTDTWEYERKEGMYWCSDDTRGIRRCRFGLLRPEQKRIVKALHSQNDREVDVIFDPLGNSGKSWLVRHLWERGQACYVPPTLSNVQGIISWVHSAYKGEGIIVIDIPRSWKWSEQLYTCIEAVKDGLVYDPRYSAHMRDIYGVKVLVLTNTMPKLDKLSADRWRVAQVSAPLS